MVEFFKGERLGPSSLDYFFQLEFHAGAAAGTASTAGTASLNKSNNLSDKLYTCYVEVCKPARVAARLNVNRTW